MSTNANSAQQFFEACETGKGWEACSAFCHPDATFSSQTAVLADISTLEGYCECGVANGPKPLVGCRRHVGRRCPTCSRRRTATRLREVVRR